MAIRMHEQELDAHTDVNTREFIKASRLVSSITGMNVAGQQGHRGSERLRALLRYPSRRRAEAARHLRDHRSGRRGARARARSCSRRARPWRLEAPFEELGYELEGRGARRGVRGVPQPGRQEERSLRRGPGEASSTSATATRARSTRWRRCRSAAGSRSRPRPPSRCATRLNRWSRPASGAPGPIDAVYKAVNKIVQVDNDLTEFSVQSVTRGIDALGEGDHPRDRARRRGVHGPRGGQRHHRVLHQSLPQRLEPPCSTRRREHRR